VVNNEDICGQGSLVVPYSTQLAADRFGPRTTILVLGLQVDLTRGLVLSVVQ